MSNKSLKTSYASHHVIETFFTGSTIQFDSTGDYFYCSHGSVINKVSIIDGSVVDKIGDEEQQDNITAFVVSPDDRLLLIAQSNGLIVKFNLVDSIIEREFKSTHKAPVNCMKIDQTSEFLATGSSDGTVKVWNLNNHYCSHNLKGANGIVSCLEFLQKEDKLYVVCASGDDSIHIFDLEDSKKIVKLSSHCSTITDLKIHQEGNQLYSVGRDKLAIVWNINFDHDKFGKPIRTIPVYESIESLVIVDNNQYSELMQADLGDQTFLATIGEEGIIKIWDTKTGAKVFTQNQSPLSDSRSPGHPCFQLCSRPNHNQICAVSQERDLFLYDLPKLELSQQLQGHIDEIFSVCWFAENRYIALACNSNDLKIIEIETSKCSHLKGHSDVTLCVKSVPSEPYLIISSSKDCTIIIWQFEKTTMKYTILFKATGHTHAIHSLGVLFSEMTFFSGSEDTTLKKWTFEIPEERSEMDISSIIARQTIKAHDQRIDAIAISPNDQLVATGSRDKTAKIFSVSNTQILGTLKGHKRGINAIQFSPVDQVIVTAADMNLRLFNLNDFTCIKTFQGHDCAVLNFTYLSSGLQLLSIGSDGNMKIWNIKSGDCTKTIDAHSGITWGLSMTADDKLLATGGQDEKLVIWKDVTKEEREQKLVNLQEQVVQEQNFINYIAKKRWIQALEIALNVENERKTLNVIREISLQPDGLIELKKILAKRTMEQLNFIVDCCVTWSSTARNSYIAQQVLNIIINQMDSKKLLQLSSLTMSITQLKDLTEKCYHRFERLARESTFADFHLHATRIQ